MTLCQQVVEGLFVGGIDAAEREVLKVDRVLTTILYRGCDIQAEWLTSV